MTGAPMSSPDPPVQLPSEQELQPGSLDRTILQLEGWLSRVEDKDADLKLKITDRLIKAYDLQRKAIGGGKKGGKFGQRSTTTTRGPRG